MSYPRRPHLVSRSKRANIGQKFKPLHELSHKSRSDRQLAHQNCLSDEQICCTRDAEEPRQHQLCYNYVCLSHPNLSGHFVVGFWSCLRNFYLRFIARKRPDDRFFGEKVRGERIFSVH